MRNKTSAAGMRVHFKEKVRVIFIPLHEDRKPDREFIMRRLRFNDKLVNLTPIIEPVLAHKLKQLASNSQTNSEQQQQDGALCPV